MYQGRINTLKKIDVLNSENKQVVWVHCASLGEFEQARPLIDQIKNEQDSIFIALTFFSPSGYDVCENQPLADFVGYLRADTRSNAVLFLEKLKPSLVIWVKYEFWHTVLDEIYRRKIPCVLIAANFRAEQYLFGHHFFTKTIRNFTQIFVQTEASKNVLAVHKITATVVGDTRIDRVLKLRQQPQNFDFVARFKQDKRLLICGSTHSPELSWLVKNRQYFNDFKIIIAPHNIDNQSIIETKKYFPLASIFSENTSFEEADILILDKMGWLAQLYRYADLAFVGGGFTGALHNVLEAAVWGKFIFFGSKHQKFPEAQQLINLGCAAEIDLDSLPQNLLEQIDNQFYTNKILNKYFDESAGATQIIYQNIQQYLNKK